MRCAAYPAARSRRELPGAHLSRRLRVATSLEPLSGSTFPPRQLIPADTSCGLPSRWGARHLDPRTGTRSGSGRTVAQACGAKRAARATRDCTACSARTVRSSNTRGASFLRHQRRGTRRPTRPALKPGPKGNDAARKIARRHHDDEVDVAADAPFAARMSRRNRRRRPPVDLRRPPAPTPRPPLGPRARQAR